MLGRIAAVRKSSSSSDGSTDRTWFLDHKTNQSVDSWLDADLQKGKVPKAKTKVEVQGSDGKTRTAEGDYRTQDGNTDIPMVNIPDGVTPTNVRITDTSEDGESKVIRDYKD